MDKPYTSCPACDQEVDSTPYTPDQEFRCPHCNAPLTKVVVDNRVMLFRGGYN